GWRSPAPGAALRREGSFEPVGDAPLRQVIRRHLDEHLVARQNANAVLAHFACRVGNDLVIVGELHAKRRVGQQLNDSAFKFDEFFLRHATPFWRLNWAASYTRIRGDSSIPSGQPRA